MTASAATPAFEGGVLRDATGLAVGCWLVDRRGLLSPPSLAQVHVATRGPGGASYAVTFAPRGGEPPSAAGTGSQGAGMRVAKPFMEMLRLVRADLAEAVAARLPRDAHVSFRDAVGALSPFVATLDADALARVPAEGRYPDGTYEGLDPTFVAGAPLARAWSRHPCHRTTLARAWERSRGDFATDEAVDAALARTLAEDGGVPRRLVGAVEGFRRHLEAASPDAAARMAAAVDGGRSKDREETVGTMGRLLSALPGNWVPRTADEWDGLVEAMPAVELCIHFAEPADWGALLDARGRWADLAGRLRMASGGRMPVGGDLASDAGDVADAFRKQVVMPAVAMADGAGEGWAGRNWYPASWSLLWGGRTACAIAKASHEWHGAMPAFPGAEGDGGDASWPRACGDGAHGNVTLAVIDSASGLAEEGRRGRHCVGTYAGRCLAGGSRILSLRARDGAWLSTLEIRFDVHGPRIGQHRGAGNGDPPREASAAAEAYLSALRDGSVPFDAAGLAPLPDRSSDPGAGIDAEAFAARMRAWSPFLPRTLRGSGHGALASAARAVEARGPRWLWTPAGARRFQVSLNACG